MASLPPETVWFISGLIVSGIVGLLKLIKPVSDTSGVTKQLTAFIFSCILNVAWPLLNGVALPATGALISGILVTFTTALTSYAIVGTAQKDALNAKIANAVKKEVDCKIT